MVPRRHYDCINYLADGVIDITVMYNKAAVDTGSGFYSLPKGSTHFEQAVVTVNFACARQLSAERWALHRTVFFLSGPRRSIRWRQLQPLESGKRDLAVHNYNYLKFVSKGFAYLSRFRNLPTLLNQGSTRLPKKAGSYIGGQVNIWIVNENLHLQVPWT